MRNKRNPLFSQEHNHLTKSIPKMIEYNRTHLEKLSIHFAGNKGLGEPLKISKKSKQIKNENIHHLLIHYFLSSFKPVTFFNIERKPKGIFSVIDNMFQKKEDFHSYSVLLAEHLYEQSTHAKIKSGELYVCYLKDIITEGELCDAIGIFKSENAETYIKVMEENDGFEIETDKGFNINKLDKGALIFQTEKEKGYKVCMIDNNSRTPEIANYWQSDFLQLIARKDEFYHTRNFINVAKEFCEEVLTEENNVPKNQQMMLLNKSVSFFKDRNKFNLEDFQNSVMPQPELIREFQDYRKKYFENNDLQLIDDFKVSDAAFKQNKKYLRSVIKLDKNFHVYVHSKHEYIEQGFDEEKRMKYYKLYFENEE